MNTLPATIRDPQFRGKALIDFLDKAQVAPDRIVIEITEKLVIENYGLFRETMAYFTDLGMSFAVDDVGAGYSGLESIAQLKPTFLKIDIALVRDVHVSPVNHAMVKAIIALGHGIGATVIAEGIQTEEETQALRAMGVDYGQGYYLARPERRPRSPRVGTRLAYPPVERRPRATSKHRAHPRPRRGSVASSPGRPVRNRHRARPKRTSSPCASSRSRRCARR